MTNSSEAPDEIIVRSVLADHRDDFAVLVERYQAVVYAMALGRLGNRSEAQDVAQETFLNAYRSLATLREAARFGPWLITIAANLCAQIRRKRDREVVLSAAAAASASCDAPDFAREELRQTLRRQVLRLPGDQREVVLLYYFERKTTVEIARLLGLTGYTVRKRLQRARKTLGERMLQSVGQPLEEGRPSPDKTGRIMALIATAPRPWTVAAKSSAATGGLGTAWGFGAVIKGAVAVAAILALVAGAWRSGKLHWTAPMIATGLAHSASQPSFSDRGLRRAADPATPSPSNESAGPQTPSAASGAADTPNSEGGVVSGRVFDADTGGPIQNATVEASTGPQELLPHRTQALSGADGRYRIPGLHTTGYRVCLVKAPEHVVASVREERLVDVQGAVEIPGIDFSATKGIEITGSVVDDANRPVTGAEVRAANKTNPESVSAYSDSSGAFTLRCMAPANDVFVQPTKDGLALRPKGPLVLPKEGIHNLVLRMEPEGSVAGKVIDASGKPLAKMKLLALPTDTYVLMGEQKSEPSDAQGRFEISGLFSGQHRLSVQFSGDDNIVSVPDSPTVDIRSGKKVSDVVVVLESKPTLAISGRVTDTAGRPVAGAEIRGYNGPTFPNAAKSGSDGRFRLTGLGDGEYQVHVRHPDFADGAVEEVAAGAEDVDFKLDHRASIDGRVVDSQTGMPIPVFEIRTPGQLETRYGNDAYTRLSDPTGKFHFDRVPPGELELSVRASGHADAIVTGAPLKPGEVRTGIVAALEPAMRVDGTVVDAKGKPVAGALLYLGEAPPDWLQEKFAIARSDAAGSFHLDTVKSSGAEISASHPISGQGSIAVAGSKTRGTVRIVLAPGGTLEGVIVVNGAPLGNAYVELKSASSPASNSGWPRSTNTEHGGRYRFASLPAGEYEVSVNPTIAAPSWLGCKAMKPATIRDGKTTNLDFSYDSGRGTIEGDITVNGAAARKLDVVFVWLKYPTDDEFHTFYTEPDDSGHYRLAGVPTGAASLEIQPSKESVAAANVPVELIENEIVRKDVNLTATNAMP